MKIHFIAIGGAVMHNLALALHKKGYKVTGSDDEIFEPSRSRLKKYGLLPEKEGWDPDWITPDLDAVILGMHARADNPELKKAQKLGIKIYSFPEYLYEQTKNKKRIVIAGSHGKTTITSMVMHVLNHHGWKFDYMVGSMIEGFDTMVGLSDESEIAVFEGDEYLTSPLDRRPKFHLYKPHVALISGIAWDHMNVFPTFENYVEQFRIFIKLIESGGTLIYCEEDEELKKLVHENFQPVIRIPYPAHSYQTNDGKCCLTVPDGSIPLNIFGRHNMLNIKGAMQVCRELGINAGQFYEAIQSFKGSAKRLETIGMNDHTAIYLDFAHAPSKVKATVHAVKEQFPGRPLVAALELHTFSSLNEAFLPQYEGSMGYANIAIVYYNPKTLEHKKLPVISPETVKKAFGRKDLQVFTDSGEIAELLKKMDWKEKNLLIMSSGNFDGVDFKELADEICNPTI